MNNPRQDYDTQPIKYRSQAQYQEWPIFRLRNRHFVLMDLFILALIPAMSLGLRVSLPWSPGYNRALLLFTITALAIKLPVFYAFRLYARYWRYASMDELVAIALAVIFATPLTTGALYFFQGAAVEGVREMGLIGARLLPRSVPLIDALLTLIMVGGTRFSVRFLEYARRRDPAVRRGKRVLVAGAGDAGELVVREIHNSKWLSLEPVGFVDDNPEKIGIGIHGVKVLGPVERIPEIVKDYRVQEVIIAMPTAPGSTIRHIFKLCEGAGVTAKSVPGIFELLSGRASISRIRDVQIEDLLRREPVEVDMGSLKEMIAGKRVLVTGAGGSIGTELCLQITQQRPAQLVVIGHGENSLFQLANQLKKLSSRMNEGYSLDLEVVVADIRDYPRLDVVFSRYTPQIVFHAAAHKHVPLMEANAEDAVTNNVLGTWNIVNLSRRHEVERFVLISSDKAVNPVNVMGMTKRIAELIVCEAARLTGLPYVSVRFGNVLGSRGSVVPYFQQQIAEGGPITVTHPEITRYFMTIPEAVQLVLQAAAMGQNGEVFVLDMGEPMKLVNLARDLIELSGFQVGHDIEIVFSGLRPGEKMYEELFTSEEDPRRTKHEKIFVARHNSGVTWSRLERAVDELYALAQNGEVDEIRKKLKQVVADVTPGYMSARLSTGWETGDRSLPGGEEAGDQPSEAHPPNTHMDDGVIHQGDSDQNSLDE